MSTSSVKAEFRKMAADGQWPALMILTVLLALVWAVGSGFVLDGMYSRWNSGPGDSGGPTPGFHSPWSVFGIARSINIATTLPMIFAGLAVTNGIKRRKVTTTSAEPDRVGGLGAKAIAHILWGTIFGIVIVIAVGAGVVIVTEPDTLPTTSAWLALAGAGVLTSILMTVFGAGVGALLRSPTATTIVLLLYMLLIENGVYYYTLIPYGDLMDIMGFLPNGSANGITGSVAADLFIATGNFAPEAASDVYRMVAGAPGAFDWWLSGLVLLAWTALFFLGGWATTQHKKVT